MLERFTICKHHGASWWEGEKIGHYCAIAPTSCDRIVLVPEADRGNGCPDDEVCKTCPCSREDDACFPGERLRAERDDFAQAIGKLVAAFPLPDDARAKLHDPGLVERIVVEVAGLRQKLGETQELLGVTAAERDRKTARVVEAEAENAGLRAQLAEAERELEELRDRGADASMRLAGGKLDALARAEVAEGRLAATREALEELRDALIAYLPIVADTIGDRHKMPKLKAATALLNEADDRAFAVLVSDRDTNEGETP